MPPFGSELVAEAPSVKMSAVDPRLPLETKLVPAQSAPHWSSISVTPGAREVSATTLRSNQRQIVDVPAIYNLPSLRILGLNGLGLRSHFHCLAGCAHL